MEGIEEPFLFLISPCTSVRFNQFLTYQNLIIEVGSKLLNKKSKVTTNSSLPKKKADIGN